MAPIHNRAPKTRLVKVADLPIVAPREHDPRSLHLIKQELLGKIRVGLTRLPITAITRGFYKRVAGRIEHFTQLEEKGVEVFSSYIRGGARPPVEIYWSNLAPGGGCYVCSDTEAIFEAYRRLSVSLVPVRIQRPKNVRASEGAIWIEAGSQGVAIAKLVATSSPSGFEAIRVKGASPVELLANLVEMSLNVAGTVREFHIEHPSALNYHHMLNATARRHARCLDSVRQMIEIGRIEHAALIARACYEAFLNFYADWLSPEFIGPRMQLFSICRSEPAHEHNISLLTNFPSLFEKTKEKAKISSLGEEFYDAFYPAMSLMAHQSYIYVERESEEFSDTPDEHDSAEKLVDCLNVVTVALLRRIANDVGADL